MTKYNELKNPIKVASLKELKEKKPYRGKVSDTDLVVILYGSDVSILYGRCLHRGALLSDGHVDGNNIICGLHNWDYRYDTGVSEYNPEEKLHKFTAVIYKGDVYTDKQEILNFEKKNPSPFDNEVYLGEYADTHPESTEPYTDHIKELSQSGLKNIGRHGKTVAMGVNRNTLPQWNDIQILPAQVAQKPLFDEEKVKTKVIIGPKAKKPLILDLPLFVSDMSFGALSAEAKIALAQGAEMAGTGIASGEGGMLPDEQKANSKYFYELASGMFGFDWNKLKKVQAFHFKGGQGAKVGTGGHLPGKKVTKEIAAVRGLQAGQPAISPATFKDLRSKENFMKFSKKVKTITGGIPIGFKLAASRIEEDIDFALSIGVDYIILDGRGGGTGATPEILRDHICVPTIPALARARRYLDKKKATNVSLIITGGLRIAPDFVKALSMGADAVAISNSAIQAIGCLGMRSCETNNCPVGIATQKEGLRKRQIIKKSAEQLFNYLTATNELMKVLVRACGYNDINKLNQKDITTFNHDMHLLTGIAYAGVGHISKLNNK